MSLEAVQSQSRIPGLDLLRALAIIFVIFSHYPLKACEWFIGPFHAFGWSGVDLFFVLSGFLISRPLFKSIASNDKISVGSFYLRRMFRILPCYWLVVALYFLVPGFKDWGNVAPAWRFLTFTRNYGVDGHLYPGFSHAWSLCVEEHFYFVLPLIVLLFAPKASVRRTCILVASLVVVGASLRALAWYVYLRPLEAAGNYDALRYAFHREIYRPTHARLDGLLFGISVALIQIFLPSIWDHVQKRANWIFSIGILVLAVCALSWQEEETLSSTVLIFPLINFGYACVLIAALSPKCFLSRIHSRIVVWGATLAYSLYLTHKAIVSIAHRWMTGHGFDPFSLLATMITFALVLITALALHFIVEKPFLKLRERFTSVEPKTEVQTERNFERRAI